MSDNRKHDVHGFVVDLVQKLDRAVYVAECNGLTNKEIAAELRRAADAVEKNN